MPEPGRRRLFTRDELQKLHDWLLDGTELKKLQELYAEVKAHPRKRTSRKYVVRNPDGSVYRRPKRHPSIPDNP
jgi:hypothetical protein